MCVVLLLRYLVAVHAIHTLYTFAVWVTCGSACHGGRGFGAETGVLAECVLREVKAVQGAGIVGWV